MHAKDEISQQFNTEKHIQESNSFKPSEYQNSQESQDTTIDISIDELYNEEIMNIGEFLGNEMFDNETSDTSENIQDAIILFVLKMYSNSALPRNIVQSLIENFKYLFKTIIAYIKSKLERFNSVKDIFQNLYVLLKEIDDIFEMLGSEHKRLKFLEDKKYYIKPKAFFIGNSNS